MPSPPSSSNTVVIICNDAQKISRAESLQRQMAVNQQEISCYFDVETTQFDENTIALVFGSRGVYLQQCGPKAPGPVWSDFVGGKIGYRRQRPHAGNGLLIKAIGCGGGMRPSVVDANAGLGQDAFVIASLGCQVVALERHPVIFALLADGIARAKQVASDGDEQLQTILDLLTISNQDSAHYLRECDSSRRPDVVFLDPMFPPRDKSAKVKKTMQLFHGVVGQDLDTDELFDIALATAKHRVVVKRPRLAEPLAARGIVKVAPLQFSGKAVRFDVYPKKRLRQ